MKQLVVKLSDNLANNPKEIAYALGFISGLITDGLVSGENPCEWELTHIEE